MACEAELRAKMFYTYTVWKDRSSKDTFMVTEPHAMAMKRINVWGGPRTAFVEWVSSDGAMDWDEAKRRLRSADGTLKPPGYVTSHPNRPRDHPLFGCIRKSPPAHCALRRLDRQELLEDGNAVVGTVVEHEVSSGWDHLQRRVFEVPEVPLLMLSTNDLVALSGEEERLATEFVHALGEVQVAANSGSIIILPTVASKLGLPNRHASSGGSLPSQSSSGA